MNQLANKHEESQYLLQSSLTRNYDTRIDSLSTAALTVTEPQHVAVVDPETCISFLFTMCVIPCRHATALIHLYA